MGHEMGSHDWYRCTEWNKGIAERFEARLKRATQKAQYLRIQACTLARSHPEVALRLLDRYFEFGEAFDHARAYVDRATAYRSLGQLEHAARSYEQALRREAEFPNVRTQAYLELSLLIATTPLPDRFEQALSILDQSEGRPTFPVEIFSWNAAYALILCARSERSSASPYAQAALNAAAAEESGFQHHKALGLVGDRYPELIQELGRIAHAEEGC